MRLISYSVLIYMSMALIWWFLLLMRQNQEIYELNIQAYKNHALPDQSIQLKEMNETLLKKRRMILGEGIVFGIALMVGLYFIQRAYTKEINTSKKQNNFLLSITHELKTPISAIKLLSQTLIKRKLSEDKQIELQNQILTESRRLHGLIDTILMATKLDEGYRYHFESAHIGDTVKTVIQRLEKIYSDAKISTIYEENLPPVHVDVMAMDVALTNIIENAIKYGGNPPEIKICVAYNAPYLQIKCADNGTGIAFPEKNKIFDKFYRIGSEDTRQAKGTGLGLYIVNKIITAHSGQIKVWDNSPNGTVFEVLLKQNT